MKTEMRIFCDEYTQKLEPFAGTLKRALEHPAGQNYPLEYQWRPQMQEACHRAETLLEKIARQHAYLLIFGPLKSGKSTLMNAISASYVSEVSSLPAYPALVYVHHGEQRAFRATTYAGDKIEFDSSQAMAEKVAEGHAELARRILDVERVGESFDPQTHFPDAIRRMDVQVPASALAESGSVLVDTPGLYTRMRFGYDVMTRDFRDTASCAIFVVKSDNLFFEKVFEEFNELLGNFSRIFLVVNIDSSKRDLGADGNLEPSLESREPQAIVQAFQSLAMSAPLREAYEQGRLNVYPIDLLKAASTRLSQGDQAPHAGAEGEENAGDGFQTFLDDLTEYLNSSDYLREFIHDSLRVGDNLDSELAGLVSGEGAGQLQREADQWRAQLDEVNGKLEALEETANLDWQAAFGEVRQERDRLIEEYTNKDRSKLVRALHEALDKWLDTDDSLQALQNDYLNPHVANEVKDDAEAIMARLRGMIGGSNGGARLAAGEARAFEQAGLRIAEIAPSLFEQICAREAPETPALELAPEDVPLKRSLSDILAFRNGKAASERFFGQDGSVGIPSAEKRKRINGKQREALREKIAAYPKSDLPQIQKGLINRMLDAYIESLGQALDEKREAQRVTLAGTRDQCEEKLGANKSLQALFDELVTANAVFSEAVGDLRARHGSLGGIDDGSSSDETPEWAVEHEEDGQQELHADGGEDLDALDEVVLLDLEDTEDTEDTEEYK